MSKQRILSGMRPTGKLHLGNYLGALSNWVKLQSEYECFFMVADWHALTDHSNTAHISKDIEEVLIDWLVAGLNPEVSTIFIQSHVPEHAELHLLLSMITPLPWLERCPTYKEKLDMGGETNYGLLGYPVLMATDILIYKANRVPVGEDQLPHLEISREIARRFNYLYGNVFPEPEPLLTKSPRIMGTDGKKKMSKSFDNYIALGEEPRVIKEKVMKMFTDPEKIYLEDPGHPQKCNVYNYHKIFGQRLGEDLGLISQKCKEGKLPCTACKANLTEILIKTLTPFKEKRDQIKGNKQIVYKIIKEGREKAKAVASSTLKEVRAAMKMLY